MTMMRDHPSHTGRLFALADEIMRIMTPDEIAQARAQHDVERERIYARAHRKRDRRSVSQ